MTKEELANMLEPAWTSMTADELEKVLASGGKFVLYTYTFSIIVMTYKRPSKKIHFLRRNESAIKYGWPYLFISLLLGWWGIPFGPIYTIQSIYHAFCGIDVTQEVLSALYSNRQ